MSGSNIFGDLALAFRRSIGSPMKKSRDEHSNENPESQAKGAVHKMKQILPLHAKKKADDNDKLKKADESKCEDSDSDIDESFSNLQPANFHKDPNTRGE